MIKDNVCVQSFRESYPNSLLATLSPERLLSSSDCDLVSSQLGIDAKRICAAYNIIILSKCADSLALDTIRHFLKDTIEPGSVEVFLLSVIRANAELLGSSLINEQTQVVRFRPRELNDADWQEAVLMSL